MRLKQLTSTERLISTVIQVAVWIKVISQVQHNSVCLDLPKEWAIVFEGASEDGATTGCNPQMIKQEFIPPLLQKRKDWWASWSGLCTYAVKLDIGL